MNLKNQADMHQNANALRAAIYGAPMMPNSGIDRHSPGRKLSGERAIEYQRQRDGSLTGLCPGSNAMLGMDAHVFRYNPRRA